jgi:UDP-N-acetylmuramoylalanine--D-glutamate ligase
MNAKNLILGAGDSGRSAAALLCSLKRGGGVVAAERLPAPETIAAFQEMGFLVVTELPEQVGGCCVVSPGFATDHPWMRRLTSMGVEILPEFALGAAQLKGNILAVTGSLGKTSMVLMAAELLRAAGKRVTVSGNIGRPVCDIALHEPDADVHVIELSSFQLEINTTFRPDAALCLNLFPNHLDRHGTLDAYAAAKAKLFAFQEPGDIACWPESFPLPVETRARRVWARPEALPPLLDTPFASGALRENLAALVAVLDPLGLPDDVDAVIRSFRFPPYRMQVVEIPGAGKVVNDSKSTCLSATMAALSALPGHVHLIVGGLPKNEDLSAAGALFAERGVSLYLLGRSAEAMQRAWEGILPYCCNHLDLSGCIHAVWARRRCGESLLFSPGCASFDQYTGYAQRGLHFQQLVETLAAQQPMNSVPVQESP